MFVDLFLQRVRFYNSHYKPNCNCRRIESFHWTTQPNNYFFQASVKIIMIDCTKVRWIKLNRPYLTPVVAKIRRLYDIANVLASVGLIEKLQLPHSRKPVFRWRQIDREGSNEKQDVGQDVLAVYEANHRQRSGPSWCDTDSVKTSQSCNSEAEDGDSCGVKKRESNTAQLGVQSGDQSNSVLRFDSSHTPIHPQEILQSEQKRLHEFMRKYVEEYVQHLATAQSASDL